jgi:predicted phosphodiesterase
MLEKNAHKRLDRIFRDSRQITLRDDDRYVIFSDLHMGNGGKRDDFVHNAPIFRTAMERYYLGKDFDLIMNGDIEELHKFLIRSIANSWSDMYGIFKEEEDRGGLLKIQGNHDSERWLLGHRYPIKTEYRNGLIMNYKGGNIFLLHGHQAGLRHDRLESLTHYMLKYGARPLAINNFAVSRNATRKYLIERRLYNFAKGRKIMTIMGHTHRPLFESQSKVDYLKFKIEQMLREYPHAGVDEKGVIEGRMRIYRDELTEIMKNRRKEDFMESLYHDGPVVPCLFNSGCAVGKRGVTALEIENGEISLVYWFDQNRSQKYFNFNGYSPEKVHGNIYRVRLKNEQLKYIFSRIRLLS